MSLVTRGSSSQASNLAEAASALSAIQEGARDDASKAEQMNRQSDLALAQVAESTSQMGPIAAVSKLASHVVSAGRDQLDSLEAIGMGLDQVDQVTQENAAVATEQAAEAVELESRAVELHGLLERFQLTREPTQD
jgi:methyl-accepting chemotaxis protein